MAGGKGPEMEMEEGRKKLGHGGSKQAAGNGRERAAEAKRKKAEHAGPKKFSPPGAMGLLYGILLSAGLSSPAQTTANSGNSKAHPKVIDAQDTFPVPPHTTHSLFYLQRTPNTNTIICELNEKNGIPDKEDPVHVLWIRYTEQKQREELNWIQKTFAYGIKSRDLGADTFELRFVSYRKTPLYLRPSPVDHKYHVYATIVGRQAILDRIFIKINPGGTFWSPNVEYLELKGVDVENGQVLMQRIKI